MAAKKKKASDDGEAPEQPKKPGKTEKKAPKRGKRAPAPTQSAGLAPAEVASVEGADALEALRAAVIADGGAALAAYRDPLFGHGVVLAALPLEKVTRTAYQRDVSEAHVDRLVDAIKRCGAFLDPVIAVRDADGTYRSPNGGHRLAALGRLGAKSVTALVVADARLAFKILALNTEKAHALKERALEAIRLLRAFGPLSAHGGGKESDYAGELEEAAIVTLGQAYDDRPRLSGSAYHPLLKRVDAFLDLDVNDALAERVRRAGLVLALDDALAPLVDGLKNKGFDGPAVRPFLLARIAPLPRRGEKMTASFDEAFGAAIEKAKAFDLDKVPVGAGARAGASSEDAEEG
jgi:ParB family chromosome partitioning protein